MLVQKTNNLRQYLLGESNRLRRELQNAESGYIGIERLPADKTEAATRVLDRNRQLALTAQLTTQLADTERALEKLRNGTYGLCDSCNNSIPNARLEVMPQAVLCLGCKDSGNKQDRKQ